MLGMTFELNDWVSGRWLLVFEAKGPEEGRVPREYGLGRELEKESL